MGAEPQATDKEVLVLSEPNREAYKEVMLNIDRAFNKARLQEIVASFKPWLNRYSSIVKRNDKGQTVACKELTAISGSSLYKQTIVSWLAFLLASPENLTLYAQSLSEEMRELWHHVLIDGCVSEDKAKSILKRSSIIDTPSTSFYYSYNDPTFTVKELQVFSIRRYLSANKKTRWGYRDKENYIILHPILQDFFFPIFFPDIPAYELSVAELPSDDYRVVEFEAESVAKFKLMQSLMSNGSIVLGTKGVGIGDVRKAGKKLGMQEFYSSDTNVYQSIMRTRFYVNALLLARYLTHTNFPPKTNSYADWLKTLFTYSEYIEEYIMPMCLPHIKGLRKQMTEENCCCDLFEFLAQWLREDSERWVPLKDVFIKIYTTLDNDYYSLPIVTMVLNPDLQKDDTDIVNDFSNMRLTADMFAREFGLTTLQSVAFLLCSLGMAELAISNSYSHDTPFAGAEYIRLTPLGRYALGEDPVYTPPEMEQEAYFELDPNRLIIRSLASPNPYAQLLSDTAKPISKNRYETSASTFLAQCHNRDDVEQKISIFKQFISDKLPPLWEQFFQSLLQHCNPLQADTATYRQYRLSPDNSELIHLLTTDERLRRLIIRAEGYLILVRSEDIHQFEEQLKKHGYLL